MDTRLPFLAMWAALLCGCAGGAEQAVERDLSARRGDFTAPVAADPDGSRLDAAAGLPGYIAHALRHSPQLRASFESWRASVHRISRARRLPEPTVGFGVFVRSVETRVGPQRARVSLQQSFPWPTTLSAGADAASARARALQRRFDAEVLTVTRRVSDAYWRLWEIRRTRAIHTEHLDVLRGLSESVRGRVMTGATTLADQQQVDLAVARLRDMLLGMDEDARAAAGALRAAIGAAPATEMPTPGQPPEALLPADDREALETSVRQHPLIASYAHLAQAGEEAAEAEEAEGLPSFTLGADWILTGEARAPGVPDSGQDAVIVGAAMRVPLWRGSYSDAASAARADAMAQRAQQRAALHAALSELAAATAEVRNAVRRVGLYRDTLVPQADAAYASVLGAYATGRGTVAQTLLAQRDLLELRVQLDAARAQYARSWARLQQVVGRAVEASPDGPPAAEYDRDGATQAGGASVQVGEAPAAQPATPAATDPATHAVEDSHGR